MILKAIARAMKSITILLSFPKDEVGNGILDEEMLNKSEFNISSVISEVDYSKHFSSYIHPFTGINMVEFYRDLVASENCAVKFVFSNDPTEILSYNKDVLVCDIHTREKTKKAIVDAGCENIYMLTDIMNSSIDGSGYNEAYGLLGSNKSTDKTGCNIEVMVHGDGAFKDPVGGIWELADPVVSPAYTSGLCGTPNEIKLKYISDNKLSNLHGEELNNAMKNEIKNKSKNLKGTMETQGTTPRRITDLIGSLADLTSGSGDKGTPVVFIQGYFDNYSDN